jgi:hypothetical protein
MLSADEDEQIYKMIRAKITVYTPEYVHGCTKESAFPSTEVKNIKIPKSYLDTIHDSLYAQE